jgi:hypothetical protein
LQRQEIVTGVVEVEGITPGGDETPAEQKGIFHIHLSSFFSLVFFVSEVWVGDGGPVCEQPFDVLIAKYLNISYRCSRFLA